MVSKNKLASLRGTGSSLSGQLLIAMPGMADKRFHRSVIYMCAHSEKGAMGLIINQKASQISFPDLLSQLEIGPDRDRQKFPELIEAKPVHIGGPVDNSRGFVLHSSDYFAEDSTLAIDADVCLTATLDILKAIARGRGPQRSLLALGYAGWSAGQLEGELQANGWLHCPADAELVFETDLSDKYDHALGRIGVDPIHLVSEAGHA